MPLRDKKRLIWALVFILCLFSSVCSAGIIDRVVAYVDNTAITLSEFRESYIKMKETLKTISEDDVINSMINRQLLLKEAAKMRLEAIAKDDLLRDYIDIKIRASILIKEQDIETFYKQNRKDFQNRDIVSVRDEIEKYLFENEVNRLLKEHLNELRSNSEIRVQLDVEGR